MLSLQEYLTLSLILLLPVCNAIAFPGPEITPPPKVDIGRFEQYVASEQKRKPFEEILTRPPLQRQQLRRRAATSTNTWSAAPDNICGYIDGDAGAEKACDAGYTCAALYDAASMDHGVIACLGPGTLSGYVTCVNSADMTASCAEQSCLQDSFVLRCTESGNDYCSPYIFQEWGGAMSYECGRSPYTLAQAIFLETTYSGEEDVRTWTPLADEGSITLSKEPTHSTSTPTPTSTTHPKSKSKAPIGGIIGGVVGGVLGIAVLVLLGYYIHRSTRFSRHEHVHGDQNEQPKPPVAPTGFNNGVTSPPPPFSPRSAPDYFGGEKNPAQEHYDTLRSENMSPVLQQYGTMRSENISPVHMTALDGPGISPIQAHASIAATSPTMTDRRESDLYPSQPSPAVIHPSPADMYPVVPQPGGRMNNTFNAHEMG